MFKLRQCIRWEKHSLSINYIFRYRNYSILIPSPSSVDINLALPSSVSTVSSHFLLQKAFFETLRSFCMLCKRNTSPWWSLCLQQICPTLLVTRNHLGRKLMFSHIRLLLKVESSRQKQNVSLLKVVTCAACIFEEERSRITSVSFIQVMIKLLWYS